MAKENDLVFPGTPLAAGEEYAPGENAFEDDNGNVTAEAVGTASFNAAEHEVSVQRRGRVAKPLQVGDDVYCVVTNIKEKMAMVEILRAEKNGEPRVVLNTFAAIPVFAVSNDYVENLHDAFRRGDIVKARVEKIVGAGIDLSTQDPKYGVIKAFSVRNRAPLKLFGSKLKCMETGEEETRKLSIDYAWK